MPQRVREEGCHSYCLWNGQACVWLLPGNILTGEKHCLQLAQQDFVKRGLTDSRYFKKGKRNPHFKDTKRGLNEENIFVGAGLLVSGRCQLRNSIAAPYAHLTVLTCLLGLPSQGTRTVGGWNNRNFLMVLEAKGWDQATGRAAFFPGLSPWLIDGSLLLVSSQCLPSVIMPKCPLLIRTLVILKD